MQRARAYYDDRSKKIFEKMGCKYVRTVLTGGNVVFGSERTDEAALTREIESGLKAVFNKEIPVILRSLDISKETSVV